MLYKPREFIDEQEYAYSRQKETKFWLITWTKQQVVLRWVLSVGNTKRGLIVPIVYDQESTIEKWNETRESDVCTSFCYANKQWLCKLSTKASIEWLFSDLGLSIHE